MHDKLPLAVVLALLVVIAGHSANAQSPIPRNGGCPSGYYSSGNYCSPTSNARPAISRNGGCPSGWYSSGNYCLGRR
jgi:hypothetical protein